MNRPHRLVATGGAVALALTALGGIAYAAIPNNTTGLINACYATSDHRQESCVSSMLNLVRYAQPVKHF